MSVRANRPKNHRLTSTGQSPVEICAGDHDKLLKIDKHTNERVNNCVDNNLSISLTKMHTTRLVQSLATLSRNRSLINRCKLINYACAVAMPTGPNYSHDASNPWSPCFSSINGKCSSKCSISHTRTHARTHARTHTHAHTHIPQQNVFTLIAVVRNMEIMGSKTLGCYSKAYRVQSTPFRNTSEMNKYKFAYHTIFANVLSSSKKRSKEIKF